MLSTYTSTTKRSVRRKKSPAQLYRDMEYLKQPKSNTGEQDAVVRFYAMLNIIVSFKGRPTYEIDSPTMEIKIKQPLVSAFYKVFQAMLNYPSNRPLKDLVKYTCHDVLYNEIEQLKIQLGISDYHWGRAPRAADTDLKLTNYQKKARESRMKIYEDTITRFYNMIDLYTPFKMRPRLWDEQKIPTEYWNSKIKQPIREAFQDLIAVMRQFPTKINKQQLLVDYTMDVILQNCEIAMTERGIRFELVNRDSVPNTPKLHSTFEMDSVWKPLPDDMKIAMGYMNRGLSLPSDSKASREAFGTYHDITKRARSVATTTKGTASEKRPGDSSEPTRLTSHLQSQLQSIGPSSEKIPVAEDTKDTSSEPSKPFATRFVQPIIVPSISREASVTDNRKEMDTNRQKTLADDTNHALSSTTVLETESSELNFKGTEARSYRPAALLLKNQMMEGQRNEQLCIGELSGLSSWRIGSGYPEVKSKRRTRMLCSAPTSRNPRTMQHENIQKNHHVSTRPHTAGRVTVHDDHKSRHFL